ncbi:MAG: RDD family protein [Acidobacteria bacterium]|nr:RDD family protein [Acidobacteriota bacterium]
MEPSTVMRCAACHAVYESPAVADCPTCRAPLAAADDSKGEPAEEIFMNTSTLPETTTTPAPLADDSPAPAQTSTLIEFPGAGRTNRPQWRKELSERVREIQQRRAQEAAREAEEAARLDGYPVEQIGGEANAPQLGLVPPPPEPAELNPIVAKALERIERARQQQQPPPPQTSAPQTNAPRQYARDAAAAATVPAREETQARDAAEPQTGAPQEIAADDPGAKTAEVARTPNLVIVPAPQGPVSETDALIKEALSKPRPRRHLAEVADDALLARREATMLPPVVDDSFAAARHVASPGRRVAGGLIDLVVVAFMSSPFAAIIELTNGNWHDPRVAASMAGVVVVVMFLYLTASVALGGRTWGMALAGLRVADERNGLIPSAGQCARRALVHMLSLAALGIPLLVALLRERRAPHDRLSRTLVVRAE